jgi:hypothetical protein
MNPFIRAYPRNQPLGDYELEVFSEAKHPTIPHLPADLWKLIFKDMNYEGLIRAAGVCRRWRAVILKHLPWRRLYTEKWMANLRAGKKVVEKVSFGEMTGRLAYGAFDDNVILVSFGQKAQIRIYNRLSKRITHNISEHGRFNYAGHWGNIVCLKDLAESVSPFRMFIYDIEACSSKIYYMKELFCETQGENVINLDGGLFYYAYRSDTISRFDLKNQVLTTAFKLPIKLSDRNPSLTYSYRNFFVFSKQEKVLNMINREGEWSNNDTAQFFIRPYGKEACAFVLHDHRKALSIVSLKTHRVVKVIESLPIDLKSCSYDADHDLLYRIDSNQLHVYHFRSDDSFLEDVFTFHYQNKTLKKYTSISFKLPFIFFNNAILDDGQIINGVWELKGAIIEHLWSIDLKMPRLMSEQFFGISPADKHVEIWNCLTPEICNVNPSDD